MSNGTQLNAGSGGDLIYTEDVGSGFKMPATKIHTGAVGVDGGPVTSANPLNILAANFPTAVVPGDATNGPTIPQIQNFPMLWNGSTWDRKRVASIVVPLSNIAVSTSPASIWTPSSGKKFRIMGGTVSLSASVTLAFQDAGTTFAIFSMTSGTNLPLNFGENGYLSTAANNSLFALGGGSANLYGTIFGTFE
jgi:hypothetical protein